MCVVMLAWSGSGVQLWPTRCIDSLAECFKLAMKCTYFLPTECNERYLHRLRERCVKWQNFRTTYFGG